MSISSMYYTPKYTNIPTPLLYRISATSSPRNYAVP